MQAEINATGPLSWMRDSIDALVARVNVQYQLDLTPESRRFVYIRYDQDGLIDWHSDYDFQTQHPRKISVTVQLSAPQTYTGGALEFHPYGELPMSKIQGTAVVFPSWVVHRACAVSSGVRRALVAWYSGPHLR
jgi:PKHD-type hydroxylase